MITTIPAVPPDDMSRHDRAVPRRAPSTRPPAKRSWRRIGAVLAVVTALTCLFTGCASLSSNKTDAVVQLQADDQPGVLRTRQQLLSQSPSWGAVRVGESSQEDKGTTALTFALPGPNLDIALGAINRLDGVDVTGTDINVERDQVDRTATTTSPDASSSSADKDPQQVRLRVEISEKKPGGAGALFQLLIVLLALFGVIDGLIRLAHWFRRRSDAQDPSTPARSRTPETWMSDSRSSESDELGVEAVGGDRFAGARRPRGGLRGAGRPRRRRRSRHRPEPGRQSR